MQSSEAGWLCEEVLQTLEQERQRIDEDLRRLTAAAAYLRSAITCAPLPKTAAALHYSSAPHHSVRVITLLETKKDRSL